MCLVELDELDAASAALEVPAEFGARPLVPLEEGTLAFARSRLAFARGDYAGALASADPLIRSADGRPPFFSSPAYLPWRSDAALAAARLGERTQAIELAEEELALARSFGAARPLGIALRGAGLAAGGAEGIELLRRSVSTLEHSPVRVELCRSLVELGAALRRSGNRAEARDHLDAAAALARRHEAKALERRALEELAASGARRPRRELSGPESLTPSERRVAELAAAGTTNREIAQQLFVSLRTVETHLTHAYGKLEIKSRSELAGALGGDEEAAAEPSAAGSA
jgi:DNA-binding CsgD family transcriptional regulator